MMGEAAIPVAGPFQREEQLVTALAAGDQRAWRQLFDDNYERIHRYAYFRTGSEADADDVASSVFVEAVKGIGNFRYSGAPVASWLFRIAHNETVDLLKKRSRDNAVRDADPHALTAVVAPGDLHRAGELRDVADALGAIKPEYREVLVLRLIEGRSTAEVAAMLRKSAGAVKVTQMRALRALRDQMEGKRGRAPQARTWP
jgi:RNA polymerase sigma-70 factor (ECF subfamily)